MELGRRVAERVIARAQADGSTHNTNPVVPTGPCRWTGTNPGNASAAHWTPFLLTSPAEFRPAPPPDCNSAQAREELDRVRAFPRGLTGASFNTNAKALYWQTGEGVYPWAFVLLGRWVLEDKMESDPLRAARAYALTALAGYDVFIASQDAKFTYWYPRPAQLDPSMAPLFPAPNFPSYPSNHSALSSARAEVLAYLFPDRADQIRSMAKEAGDSRIWAGIHFEMDNAAGVEMGRKVARKFIDWAAQDGSATGN
jgi:membrane-associated phospholipid phosphatase